MPGLPFDPATRELSGMPEAAASYPMIYRVMDGDANTADGDADELRFTITVQPPPEGAAAGGDQVFAVDMAALPAGRFSFTEPNNNPPVPLGGGSASQETAALHQAPPSVGAQACFLGDRLAGDTKNIDGVL